MPNLTTVEIHKEIDLVQNCISRMSSSSFNVKGWFITLIAVLFAIENIKITNQLLYLIIALSLVFAFLNSRYIAYERCFRKLYTWNLQKREEGSRERLYELNIKKYFKPKFKDYISIGIIVFYGVPILICIFLLFTM